MPRAGCTGETEFAATAGSGGRPRHGGTSVVLESTDAGLSRHGASCAHRVGESPPSIRRRGQSKGRRSARDATYVFAGILEGLGEYTDAAR